MAAVGTVRIVWSGGEDDFCAAKIGTQLAIEERCDAGLGAIYQRLTNGTWKVYDISEVIRLSLIGAGMSAEAAKKKVDVHVHENPNGLAPSLVLAVQIIQTALIGGQQDDPVGKAPGVTEEKAPSPSSEMMDGSVAPQSMDLEQQPSNGQQELSMS